jgi:hypothetical protein
MYEGVWYSFLSSKYNPPQIRKTKLCYLITSLLVALLNQVLYLFLHMFNKIEI